MFIVSRIWTHLDRIFENVSDVFLGHSSVRRMQLSDNVDDRSTFAQLEKDEVVSFIALLKQKLNGDNVEYIGIIDSLTNLKCWLSMIALNTKVFNYVHIIFVV